MNKEVLAEGPPLWLSILMSTLLANMGLEAEPAAMAGFSNGHPAPEASGSAHEIVFAARTRLMKPSAVRESLKLASQPEVISLAGGLPAPELFPMDRVKSALDQIWSKVGPASLQYSETEGIGALRDWIASRFSSGEHRVTRDNILITTGAQQALDLIGRILLDEGASAIVENPTYLALLSAWRPLGLQFLPVPSDANGIDTGILERSLKRKPKLIYVCPNFQNPAGTTLSLARRQRLIELAFAAGVPILEDDAYAALRYEGEPLPSLWSLSNSMKPLRASSGAIIHVGSFSKVLMPGLRLGWVVAPEAVINKLVLAKQAADLHTSTLNQYLALELLKANYLEQVVPQLIEAYRIRRDTMLGALEHYFPPGITWTRPEGGMFLLLTLPAHMDAEKLLPMPSHAKSPTFPASNFTRTARVKTRCVSTSPILHRNGSPKALPAWAALSVNN